MSNALQSWMKPDGSPGQILTLWPKVMAAVGKVEKSRSGAGITYKFRSIEDVVLKLQPALIELGLSCTVAVDELEHERIPTKTGGTIGLARLKLRLRFIAPDGTWIEQESYGEAMDTSDKATNKAETAAVKNCLLHGLQIPTGDHKRDPDTQRPEPGKGDQRGRWSRMAGAVLQQINAAKDASEVARIMDGEAYKAVPKNEAAAVRKLAAQRYKALSPPTKAERLARSADAEDEPMPEWGRVDGEGDGR
jgi:hypothetical protein